MNFKKICDLYIILQVLGSGVVGSGIWLLVKDYNARELSALFNIFHLEYMAYFLTCGGGAVFVLAFCGCCGTMKKEKFVLGFVSTRIRYTNKTYSDDRLTSLSLCE